MVMALLLIAAMFTGCSKPAETEVEETANAEEEKKVDFPTKPITIICPFSAGGGTDAVARAIADIAKNYLDESVVVENKTGGTGVTGMTSGMQAKPDGYTVTMVTVELVTLPQMGLAPDTFTYESFKPVVLLNGDPSAITVKADAPWNTLEEFINYAKENPGKVKVGNAGSGSIWHLGTIGLEKATGAKFLPVPYQGGANEAVVALLGGHLDAVAVSPAEVGTHVKAGTLKILGVAADNRQEQFPDVKTYKEMGVDLSIGTWRGLAVPKDTPDEVVAILQDAFVKAAEDQGFKDFLNKGGLGIDVRNAEKFAEKISQEYTMFTEITKEFKSQN
jgi:tripartite-type tricarboxylate transporter receptor subunit TctC